MNGLGRFRGPVLMTVWVLAPPVAVLQSDTGRVQVAVGGAVGSYEVVTRTCEGDVVSSRPVEFTSYGARVDVRVTGAFRVSGFGGVSSVEGEPGDPDGGYGGFLAAYEWDRVGIGAGWARYPGWDYRNVPTGYVRFGRRATHFRADLFYPRPAFGATGDFRVGVGFTRPKARGFVGLGAGRAFDSAEGRGGSLPISRFRSNETWT